MPLSRPVAVVLDLDGVILKSNFIKHQAMLSLFADRRTEQDAISAYILANGGVRRDDKIRHILKNILGTEPAESIVATLLSRYAHHLEQLLAVAPLVEGVEEFLAAGGHPFYVSSSAPEAEVNAQLSRRRLDRYFAAVFAAGTRKASALRQVSARHPDMVTVFFGDSIGDWEAAREGDAAFVAVVSERDNFAGHPVTRLADFASLPSVQTSMHSAVLAREARAGAVFNPQTRRTPDG